MTRPQPPPQVCLLDSLLAANTEQWVRQALSANEILQEVVRFQARDCEECRNRLIRLAPDLLKNPEPLPDKATIDAMVAKLEAAISAEGAKHDAWDVGGT